MIFSHKDEIIRILWFYIKVYFYSIFKFLNNLNFQINDFSGLWMFTEIKSTLE